LVEVLFTPRLAQASETGFQSRVLLLADLVWQLLAEKLLRERLKLCLPENTRSIMRIHSLSLTS
jgi:hypothetical protein